MSEFTGEARAWSWLVIATLCIVSTIVTCESFAADGEATATPDTQTQAQEQPAAAETAQSQDGEQRPGRRGPRGQRGERGPRGEDAEQPDAAQGAEGEKKPEDDGLVSVSFTNAEIRQIAQFYMRQLKKPVILDDGVQQQRITIISDQRMEPRQAMELIGNALRAKGVMIIESPNQIDFLPLSKAAQVPRPVIGGDVSVTTLENQSQIVDKVFDLKHYDATKLQDVLKPLLPEYALIFVDPNLNRVVVTDAAANLRRIEELVTRLDVERATQTLDRIFKIEHGDASEIVSVLRIIIAGTLTKDQSRAFLGEAQKQQQPQPDGRGGEGRGGRFGPSQGSTPTSPPGNTLVVVEQSEVPILLQADLSRNWIIAVASPSVMEVIEKWVIELDRPKEVSEPYALFDIKHVDITELSGQLTQAINTIPDADVRNSVRVVAFPKSRRLMVYGSQRGRYLVEQLLKELDVETSQYRIFKEIPLTYASAEAIANQIEELFSDEEDSNSAMMRYWYGGNSGATTSDAEVRVTFDIQRNSITVMTDPVKMQQIETLIAQQWDRAVDLDAAQPRVYYLRYTDPAQVQKLLEETFSGAATTTSGPYWYQSSTTSSASGRFGGQFTFQALAGTNILTVTSSTQENYKVIDRILAEIDQPQEAGLPIIVELKHANAEDVAEQLNAMFSEPGTPSSITRTERGLSQALRASPTDTQSDSQQSNNNNANNQQGDQNQVEAGAMGFWWAQSRTNIDEVPTSNLIGKPRFVPINRRNALMVLAPTGYIEPLQDLVAELDKPGSQVLIQAIIAEIQHDDESSLGVRLASDPSILNDTRLADQSIGGSVGSSVRGTHAFDEFFTGTGIVRGNVNLNFLIQLLIRKVNLKIMNEPRVYTSDNEEAHFFDGQDVPFVEGDQTSTEGSSITRTFVNREVGTRLHVRPHITQEGDVNLEINLELSRLVTGETVFGNFIVNRRSTTTNVTLKDGQTVVISGIIQKEDINDVRKLPLLGDIPFVGEYLFSSTEKGLRNREVIAFITPRIVDPGQSDAQDLSNENQDWLQRLRDAMRNSDEEANGSKPPTDLPAGMETDADAPGQPANTIEEDAEPPPPQ